MFKIKALISANQVNDIWIWGVDEYFKINKIMKHFVCSIYSLFDFFNDDLAIVNQYSYQASLRFIYNFKLFCGGVLFLKYLLDIIILITNGFRLLFKHNSPKIMIYWEPLNTNKKQITELGD